MTTDVTLNGDTPMPTLTPWDPIRDLEELQNRLAAAFGRAPVHQPPRSGDEAMTAADWSPLVDISEDDHAFLIELDLPQIPKDAIRITAENGVLTIAGERKLEKDGAGRRYHRVERPHGRFTRRFALPDNVDPTKVTASYQDGVLQVTLGKAEQAKPKQIEIKVN